MQRLLALLQRLDGRGYKVYKELRGEYAFPDFTLTIDHVQGDPFAAPSRVRVFVPQRVAGFPSELYANASRRVGLEHYLAEVFAQAAQRVARRRGTGHSGEIRLSAPGQQVLPRTAVRVSEAGVEARFTVGLPAAG
ncbi:MAG TPA: ATPase, partial [Anaerolineae bacterium]|nr:ATPase [Anaerolineae bacterium]